MTVIAELRTERGHGAQGCNSFHVNDGNVSLTHRQYAFKHQHLIAGQEEKRNFGLNGGGWD